MDIIRKISVRPLSALVSNDDEIASVDVMQMLSNIKKLPTTPKKQNKATSTPKKFPKQSTIRIAKKICNRTKQEPLPVGQLKIDSYFKNAAKTFKIEPKNEVEKKSSSCRRGNKRQLTNKKSKTKHSRKKLFSDDDSTISNVSKSFVIERKKIKLKPECTIDLCTSDTESEKKVLPKNSCNDQTPTKPTILLLDSSENTENVQHSKDVAQTIKKETVIPVKIPVPFTESEAQNSLTKSAAETEATSTTAKSPTKRRQKPITNMKSKSNLITSKSETENHNFTTNDKKLATRTRNQLRCSNKALNSTSICNEINKHKTSQHENICEIPHGNKGHILIENAGSASKSKLKIPQSTKLSAKTKSNLTTVKVVKSENVADTIPKRVTRSGSNALYALSAVSVNRLNNTDAINESISSNLNESVAKKQNTSEETSNTATTSGQTSHEKSKSSITNISTENLEPTTSKIECPEVQSTTVFGSTAALEIIDIRDNEHTKKQILKTQKPTKNKETAAQKPKRPKRICPPYRLVEGTTFAVDAFQYGSIEGVTHYFLTHFHADHYVGLSGKFSNDIYMSQITARLVRTFIPVKEEFIHLIELNKPIIINNVEVTAIDANHCPGAIMLIFKTADGECILHTGDFRACPEMESEPIFWNNDIHTIYLDTTYISAKYAFCDQTESIDRAINLMNIFREENVGTRVLYVCGSYLVGKEKFWSAIARHFNLKTWTEGKRKQALLAINDAELKPLFAEQPHEAQLHIISMAQLGYNALLQYLDKYSTYFDVIFALRPSGWERGNRPQYRGKVNIIGIEYSEHSSHDDLKRFVGFLRPLNVISTVPMGTNPLNTPKIPRDWCQNAKRQFQPSITSFFKLKPENFTINTPLQAQVSETNRTVCDKNITLTPLMAVSPVKSKTNNATLGEESKTVPEEKKINGLRKSSLSKINSPSKVIVKDNQDDWLS